MASFEFSERTNMWMKQVAIVCGLPFLNDASITPCTCSTGNLLTEFLASFFVKNTLHLFRTSVFLVVRVWWLPFQTFYLHKNEDASFHLECKFDLLVCGFLRTFKDHLKSPHLLCNKMRENAVKTLTVKLFDVCLIKKLLTVFCGLLPILQRGPQTQLNWSLEFFFWTNARNCSVLPLDWILRQIFRPKCGKRQHGNNNR